MAREVNAQEIVNWLNQLESRCRRLRWVSAIAVTIAVVALVLPALPKRFSPWPIAIREAESFQSPDQANTGMFRVGVETGHDPRLVLSSTNRHAHASIELDESSPLLDLHDRGGHQVALRLAAPVAWESGKKNQSPVIRKSGLNMVWPGSSAGLESRIRLGGEHELLGLDLWNAKHGGIRMWSGKRDTPRNSRGEPIPEDTREPGSAVALLDGDRKPRVLLGLTGPATMAPDPEATEEDEGAGETATEVGPVPAIVLLDSDGKERIRLRLENIPAVDGRDTVSPSLVMQDSIGLHRLVFGFDEEGRPSIRIMEGDEVIWTAP